MRISYNEEVSETSSLSVVAVGGWSRVGCSSFFLRVERGNGRPVLPHLRFPSAGSDCLTPPLSLSLSVPLLVGMYMSYASSLILHPNCTTSFPPLVSLGLLLGVATNLFLDTWHRWGFVFNVTVSKLQRIT